jgi:DnaJ-domain-containing protein 1
MTAATSCLIIGHGLEVAVAEMRKCAALHHDVQAAFERAKAVVLAQGSPTLLAELDRILLGLESDLLGDLLRGNKWDDAQEVLRLMIAELDTIRQAAERGEAAPASHSAGGASRDSNAMPCSLDDAYAVLNVHPSADKQTIKRVVDALRLTWHPDRARDPAERERHTLKIQNINAAWDIIDGKRAAS